MEEKQIFKLEVVSIRLVKDAPILSEHKIKSPEDAIKVVGDLLCELDREVLCIINLKTDGTPINCNIASVGILNQSLAHPRELFKSSILSNAASMIMVHNHLGRSLVPSQKDTEITDRMIKLTNLMGIPLLDHVIVGRDNSEYFSFQEKKIMTTPVISNCTDYKAIDFNNSFVAEKTR